MRIQTALSVYYRFLQEQVLQLPAVGGNQAFFQWTALEFHRDVIVIGADQPVAPFKMSDLHQFCLGQPENGLYPLGFFIFQIEDDFCLAVVDDAFPVLAIVQSEEVVQVLGGADRRAAVAADLACYVIGIGIRGRRGVRALARIPTLALTFPI